MRKILFKIFILLVLLFSACKIPNYYILTKIYPDGSSYRRFETKVSDGAPLFITGDTSLNPFPVFLDSTWKISWVYGIDKHQPANAWPIKRWGLKIDSTKKLFVFAQKNYTPIQLSQSLNFNKSSWKNVNPQVIVKKKFGLFFITYTYQVAFKELNTLKRIPVTRYVTIDELNFFRGENPLFASGKDSVQIKNAVEHKICDQWLYRSVFEEYYRILLKHFGSLKNKSLDSTILLKEKDLVFNEVIKKVEDLEVKKFISSLNEHFQTDLFNQLNENKVFQAEINKIKSDLQTKVALFAESFTFDLLTPGKLINTNAKSIKGDTLRWNMDAYKFFFNDYIITAEYKVANTWTFWVLGILLFLVASIFFWKKKLLRNYT